MRRARCLPVLLAAAILAFVVSADAAGPSTVQLAREGASVRADVLVETRDIDAALGPKAGDAAVSDYIVDHARVVQAGAACTSVPDVPRRTPEHVALRVIWVCPAAAGIRFRATLFQETDKTARTAVTVAGEGSDPKLTRTLTLDGATPEIDVTAPEPGAAALDPRIVLAGIGAMLLGADHVAFVVGLVLWTRRRGPLLRIAAAFVVAHSAGLALAGLGIFPVPAWLTAPALGASVAYVAAENFLVPRTGGRWRPALVLGVVHGFGFADALGGREGPPGGTLAALGSFNLGLELGLAALLALALPALAAAERGLAGRVAQPRPALAYALSALLLLAGGWWTVTRALS